MYYKTNGTVTRRGEKAELEIFVSGFRGRGGSSRPTEKLPVQYCRIVITRTNLSLSFLILRKEGNYLFVECYLSKPVPGKSLDKFQRLLGSRMVNNKL
jgi:hypothetical protein